MSQKKTPIKLRIYRAIAKPHTPEEIQERFFNRFGVHHHVGIKPPSSLQEFRQSLDEWLDEKVKVSNLQFGEYDGKPSFRAELAKGKHRLIATSPFGSPICNFVFPEEAGDFSAYYPGQKFEGQHSYFSTPDKAAEQVYELAPDGKINKIKNAIELQRDIEDEIRKIQASEEPIEDYLAKVKAHEQRTEQRHTGRAENTTAKVLSESNNKIPLITEMEELLGESRSRSSEQAQKEAREKIKAYKKARAVKDRQTAAIFSRTKSTR